MAERKQIPIFESCYKIAEYLKKNNDAKLNTTPTTIKRLCLFCSLYLSMPNASRQLISIEPTSNSINNGSPKAYKTILTTNKNIFL